MYVRESVPECDFTGKKYEANVQGAYAVAQGATGRAVGLSSKAHRHEQRAVVWDILDRQQDTKKG